MNAEHFKRAITKILSALRFLKPPKIQLTRRTFSTMIIVLSVGSIAAATFVAQRQARRATQNQRAQQTARITQAGPTRPLDPNRAPQNLVDDALYASEEFFGGQSPVARPYNVALERVTALLAQYPKDSRLHLNAARLAERLSQFDRAATEMAEYVDLKQRKPDALRRLADFYHNRAMFVDEVKTLRELAQAIPVNLRAPIYKRAADVVRSHTLKEFKPADFFADLVAANPDNVQPVKNYVEELTLAKQNKEALAVLAQFQPRFPSELAYFLKTRAALLAESGDRRAAEEVYSSAFNPTWPRAVASDYYELLRNFGRYRTVRRALQEKVKAGATDFDTNARLFSIFAYEGNYEQAAQLMRDLESRRAGGSASSTQPISAAQPAPVAASAWTPQELSTASAMLASVGQYDQASRYLYTLYLIGGMQSASATREDALYRLFSVMIEAAGSPTRVAAGDLSLYKDIAQVDQNPGVINGVLSLILSGYNVPQEFATEEKAAAGYFNRAFAYRIFTAFKQEYPQSNRLGEMYLAVINVFSSLGEHQLAIQAGREFRQLYPSSPRFADVTLRMADSYVALKDRANERLLLADLLDRLARSRPKGQPLIPVEARRWTYGSSPAIDALIDKISYSIEAYSDTYDPTEGGGSSVNDTGDDEEDTGEPTLVLPDKNRVTYSSVLERMVASFAANEKKTETAAFFWSEIKKHPAEEGLYERFLRWLGQAELINEQLRAYNSAIRQFDNNTWYHRLARWYVRQKRGRELNQYSRKLISIFDEEEITEYLYRFAGYGATAEGDSLNWDEEFAYQFYTLAHNRFPRNLFFVRGMLTYLSSHNVPEWAKLSAQYYFMDRSIRDPYLGWLSKQNQLRDRYAQARQQAAQFTYKVFAADASLWLSHYDEALDVYRQLVAMYPGQRQYADRLADLTRSFGQQDNKFYEESATVLAKMADIYPSNHEYRIKAGEVFAELGDFKRAGRQWDKLTELEPGERNTYLEVATVYWDYYQFDDALRVFRELRNVTGDPAIYAYRMGAVYEGKGDMDAAVAEYVKVLNEPGVGRDTVTRRLAQLARRKGMPERIAAAYQQAHAANPSDWQLIIGYAFYQAERDHQADALTLLRSEVDRMKDVAFLETVRDLFRWILRPEDEQQVLARLTNAARDEREAMMYRLQQASFLERHGKRDEAIAIIDKLTADYPANVGVIEESSQFYWRAGLKDRALVLYKRSLERARGPNRRALTLQYARRLVEAGKPADAEATLRAFYNENRADTEVFSELAKTLGAENRLNELAALYDEAFKDARESGLAGDELKSRVAELRAGMAATLDGLGKYSDSLDQQIEIINQVPEDADRLAATIDYAERHNLVDRLVGYYEKLSKESFKNYRWQLVLARIYERRGDLASATDQYRAAVANEPQRSDLRLALASTLARQRRFDEAIAALRDGWALAGRDPSWLVEIARIQIRQGKRDDAIQTIRQALAAKQNQSAYAQFRLVEQLAAWGLNGDAARIYSEIFARLPKTLKDEVVGSEDVAGYIRALVRSEPASSAYQKIERMRAQYSAIGDNSQDTDGWKAKSIVSAIDQTMRADFGRGVIDYASPTEAASLASAVEASIARLTNYADMESLRRYLGIARGANLVTVEEKIQARMKDLAYAQRQLYAPGLASANATERAQAQSNFSAASSVYYSELRALVSFYNRHAAYSRAAEVLEAEHARDQFKDRFDYQNQMANQYRLLGDRDRELAALRRAYQMESGAVVMSPESLAWIDRYLTLLHSAGMRSELEQIASTPNPHQLQVINFLVEKGEKALAQKAIASVKSSFSPAWVAARNAEVGLFLKDTSPETEGFFKAALDIRPIGQMLKRKVNSSETLIGDDWFIEARNYGYWLALTESRAAESRRYAVAEIEGHPLNSQAQLELAAFYLDRKDPTHAAEHNALAGEIDPNDRTVTLMRGSIAFARGDRKGAMDAWNSLMAGRVSVEDAQLYLRVMADHGMLREALPQVQNFMLAFINRKSRNEDERAKVQAIEPLIREIASRAAGDQRLISDVATFFHTTITQLPGNTSIGQMLIQESLLPEAALASIYRTIHQRLSDVAASVFGTDEYENGYYSSGGYVYPAKDLSDFRRRFIDYLIRARSFDEARLLVTTIRDQQRDLELALEERGEDDYSEDHYTWLPLAAALIELRAGSDATKAMAELRAYCGLNKTTGVEQKPSSGEEDQYETQEEINGAHEQCLKAYALLVAEHKDAEADALLYDAYSKAVHSRFADDASLAGLAELEARRGRADEAARLLRQLVERSTDNLKALQLAAETAARIKRYVEAVEFRQQIARANPEDAQNKLELARAMAAGNRAADAINQLVALTVERTTPNSIRAQAAEVTGEIVRANPALASQASSQFDARIVTGDFGAMLARAATSEAAGKPDEARATLALLKSGSLAAVAQMKLGLISLAAGRNADAVMSFEQAIYLDADGTMTDAIAFRAPGPRAQLILLYNRVGRDAAAIQLAEGEPGGRPSLIGASNSESESSGQTQASQEVAFEPSLLAAREKSDGLRTIADLNESANAKVNGSLLAALSESFARLGQYDKAIIAARASAAQAARPEERAAIEKRLAEIEAADRARQVKKASQLRIDRANTTGPIYASRLIGS